MSEELPVDEIQERLATALADQYAIERMLGAGGMALVYLARDLKHGRMVAIKVLRPELAASMGAERFLREVQITAQLSHPHILALYDSGEAEGLLYYVMPFIQGESLRDLLDRERQMAIDDALKITREVGEALAHAHSYGLIHRDIKPENIMLSGGHAIVADFGIARAFDAAGGQSLTQTGMAVGTPAYMSPEQGAGDPNVDARADIYSLGCMLYEMLVGQIPFPGPTAMAIMARHSMDAVPPPSIVRQSIPPELEDVIFCALAKAPADRFRTAAEMVEALDAVATGGAPKVRLSAAQRRPSAAARYSGVQQAPPRSLAKRVVLPAAAAVIVLAGGGFAAWHFLGGRHAGPAGDALGGLDPTHVAVLYFQDLSRDSSLGYAADGLTEGLIDRLSTVQGLDVVSRNGVAPYRNMDIPRDSIARALKVGTLVLGSVEPEGDNDVRVTTRVVDGTGTEVDRHSVRLPKAALLNAQDSVAADLSTAFRQILGHEVDIREQRAGTSSLAAWTLLQRGAKERKDADALLGGGHGQQAFAAFQRADSLFALASKADPKWPDPRIRMGQIAFDLARLSYSEPVEAASWLAKGQQQAQAALAIAPNDADAVNLRGRLTYLAWLMHVSDDPAVRDSQLTSADSDLQRAVRIDPNLASAYSALSSLYYQTKDVSQALLAAQHAYDADTYLDGMDAIINRLYVGNYDLTQFGQARRWCDLGFARYPGETQFTECQLWLMSIPNAKPDPGQAWQLLARLDSITPPPDRAYEHDYGLILVAGALGKAGLIDSADAVLARARADAKTDPDHKLLGYAAVIRLLIGQKDTALTMLTQYVATHPGHSFQVGGDLHWWYRSVQDDPRFKDLLARAK